MAVAVALAGVCRRCCCPAPRDLSESNNYSLLLSTSEAPGGRRLILTARGISDVLVSSSGTEGYNYPCLSSGC